MKALFIMNTPACVHTWKNLIYTLTHNGNQVKILARDYGCTLELLDKYGLEYRSFKPIRSKYLKIFEILTHVWKGHQLSRKFNPTIIVGFGVDAAITSALVRKPSIIFTDSEPIPVQHFLTRLFATAILTPSCFRKDLGKKQVRFAGYKELSYLHPNRFQPDPQIFSELGINGGEKYVVLRFNAFDAFHDVGKRGFTSSTKYQLVREVGKYARVFISAEEDLPQHLQKYELSVPFERIHHVLYYAQLLITDTQTMTTEAAILGTPAIRCNSFVGPDDMGNFIELEQDYSLICCFRESTQAIQKALELLQQPDLKEQWAKKRERLLADKIDVTQFMVDFIENYHKSFYRYREESKNRQ